MYGDGSVFVSTKNDMPEGDHFAILVFSSIYVPGDERSRTAPGHGYPEHNEPVVNYIAFKDEAAWKTEIARRMSAKYSYEDFVPVRVSRARVSTHVEVK